jgi:GDP-L-fucose synthase
MADPVTPPVGTKSDPFRLRGRRVWLCGHRGMLGRAIAPRLSALECEVLTAGRESLDLRRQADVEDWMATHRPEVVIMAAATVGGIHANDTRPAEFLFDNLAIESNTIHGAWRTGVAKLLFFSSACVYPRDAAQPMGEDALLTGPFEPTNEWYATAKLAGLKMAQAYRRQYGCDFITAVPTNLYGPGDTFDVASSHVVPALMRKAHEAKQSGHTTLDVWGSGRPIREFLHVDDCAAAAVFLLEAYSDSAMINVGSGQETTIRELAETICDVVAFDGRLRFDGTKPDGSPRKLLDSARIGAMGWRPRWRLREGLAQTYEWFLEHHRKRPALSA